MTWKGGLCRYDNIMITIVSSLGCLLALAKKCASLVAGRLPRWRVSCVLIVFLIGVQVEVQLTTNFIQVCSDCVQYKYSMYSTINNITVRNSPKYQYDRVSFREC